MLNLLDEKWHKETLCALYRLSNTVHTYHMISCHIWKTCALRGWHHPTWGHKDWIYWLDQPLYFTKWQKVRERFTGVELIWCNPGFVNSPVYHFVNFVDSESENEDDWEEMGDEEQENSTICLFCEQCFRNADNVWNHCVTRHGVDILKITRMHSKQPMQILWFLDFILVPNLQCTMICFSNK